MDEATLHVVKKQFQHLAAGAAFVIALACKSIWLIANFMIVLELRTG